MKPAVTLMYAKQGARRGWLRTGGQALLSALLFLIMTGAQLASAQTAVDLTIDKGPFLVSGTSVFPGDVTAFEVTVTNPSLTVDATDLVIMDQLPSDHINGAVYSAPFNIMNTHGTIVYDAGLRKITWSDVDLLRGTSATLTYEVAVVTQFENSYANVATITDIGWIYDPNLLNNSVSFSEEIAEPLKFPAKSAVQALAACQNSYGDWHIIAGQFNGPILRSVPDGYLLGNRRWSVYTEGLPAENLIVNDLFISPEGVLFAAIWGYDGLYRSEDCARSWEAVDFPGMASQDPTRPFNIVYAITQGPGGPLGYVLYASADMGRLFRSLDGGITWDMTMSLPGGSSDTPWALAADPHTPGIVFAGTFGNGTFISRDYGEVWTQTSSSGLPVNGAVHVFDLEFDPEKMPQTLWAATAEGIYFTQDEGASWAPQNNGLFVTGNNGNTFNVRESRAIAFSEPNDADPGLDYSLWTAMWGHGIYKLDGDRFYGSWDPVLLKNLQANDLLVHNGVLFVGTDGQGMAELSVASTSTANEDLGSEIPDGFALSQNYPNPFNPVTSISFDLPEASQARLAVFDLLGRELAVLVDGKLAGGQHAVSFDAANLPSGMYIYRLETASRVLSNSMVLMK